MDIVNNTMALKIRTSVPTCFIMGGNEDDNDNDNEDDDTSGMALGKPKMKMAQRNGAP